LAILPTRLLIFYKCRFLDAAHIEGCAYHGG